MPITNGAYVNPGWHNGTSPYINDTELNAISDTLETVPIVNGGTGAITASAALVNLGAEPIANVRSKGSANTPVYFNSSGVATPISSALPVRLGGTGATSASAALTSLGAAPIANFKSKGSANTPVYFNSSGVAVPISSPIPISLGGTNATTASNALTNLGAEPIANVRSKGSANTPVYFNSSGVATPISSPLPISLGGTGVSSRGSQDLGSKGKIDNIFIWHWSKVITLRITTAALTGNISVSSFIPEEYRPTATMYFSITGYGDNTSYFARLGITGSGTVTVDSIGKTGLNYTGTVTYLAS